MPIAAKQLDASQQLLITLAINAQVDVDVFTAIGGDEFNPSVLPSDVRSIEFIARMYTTDAAVDGYVQLYNLTDGAPVAGTEFQSNSQTPERFSVVLDVPADLPNLEKSYEVQLRMGTADGTNSVFCQKAELRIRWT
jgi:hypothetical protein